MKTKKLRASLSLLVLALTLLIGFVAYATIASRSGYIYRDIASGAQGLETASQTPDEARQVLNSPLPMPVATFDVEAWVKQVESFPTIGGAKPILLLHRKVTMQDLADFGFGRSPNSDEPPMELFLFYGPFDISASSFPGLRQGPLENQPKKSEFPNKSNYIVYVIDLNAKSTSLFVLIDRGDSYPKLFEMARITPVPVTPLPTSP